MTNLNLDKTQKTVICDTETGGVSPFVNSICSISMKVFNEPYAKTWYILPYGKQYDKKAMEINGITEEFLKEKGQEPREVIKEIILFIKKYANYNENNLIHYHPFILAHNAIFDLQFLNVFFNEFHNRLFSSYFHYHPIDTMILMKGLVDSKVIPLKYVGLKHCYKYLFGKDFENQHTSEADVLATEQVYKEYLKLLLELKEHSTFVKHVQNHLSKDEVVQCKICGKFISDVI